MEPQVHLPHKGTVVWFQDKLGYGFISPDVREGIAGLKDGKDVYVHFSGIRSEANRKNLHQGQRVQFEVASDARGPMAVNVQVV